jgi:hypothetical protein
LLCFPPLNEPLIRFHNYFLVVGFGRRGILAAAKEMPLWMRQQNGRAKGMEPNRLLHEV